MDTQIHFRLDQLQKTKFELAAIARGITLSELVKLSVELYLQQNETSVAVLPKPKRGGIPTIATAPPIQPKASESLASDNNWHDPAQKGNSCPDCQVLESQPHKRNCRLFVVG